MFFDKKPPGIVKKKKTFGKGSLAVFAPLVAALSFVFMYFATSILENVMESYDPIAFMTSIPFVIIFLIFVALTIAPLIYGMKLGKEHEDEHRLAGFGRVISIFALVTFLVIGGLAAIIVLLGRAAA